MSSSASYAQHNRLVIKVDLLGGKIRSRIFVGDALLGAQVGGAPVNALPAGVVGDLPSSAGLSVFSPKIRSLSDTFTAALFDRERKELLDRLVHVKGSRSGIEVVVEAESAVSHLPFELLRVRPNQFLVDSPRIAFYRRVGSGPGPRRTVETRPGRLSILALAPVDDTIMDGEALAAVYADALATGDAEVTTIAAGHERSFVAALRSRPFHVVHAFTSAVGTVGAVGAAAGAVAGGTPGGVTVGDGAVGDAGAASLAAGSLAAANPAARVSDDGGGAKNAVGGDAADALTVRSPGGVRTLPAERLAALLADAAVPVPLVVLGGRARRPDGLAQELVRHGVGRVLATQDDLGGPYASSSMVLTRALFTALAADPGLSVAAALAQARQALVVRHPDDEYDHHGAPLVRSYWTTVHTLFAAADDPPLRTGAAVS